MRCFRKIFAPILLLFIFFSLNAYAEVVKKIEVTGNDRVSKETIVVFGDIAIGKDYEASDVNTLIKKLYDTTLFSNISVNIKNNVLSIVVDSFIHDGNGLSGSLDYHWFRDGGVITGENNDLCSDRKL